MLIPIGSAAGTRRRPRATIALIVVNFVVFALTWPIEAFQEARIEAAALRLGEAEARLEAEFVGRGAAWKTWVPSRFRKPTAVETAFWTDFAAGEVVPADDHRFVEWASLRDAFETSQTSTIFWRLGYHPGDPSPFALVASMFLHHGFFHVLFNMLFLWTVGANTEDTWGARWFLGLYFVGGLTATLAHVLATRGVDVLLVGASGAVATIMGAYMVRHFATRIRYFSLMPIGTFHLPAGLMLGLWFAGELYAGLSKNASNEGVAFWAHVGGFALGAAVALLFKIERLEEKVIAPELQVAERARRDESLEARVRALEERGEHRQVVEEFAREVAADPTDLGLRRRYFEILRHAVPWRAKAEGEHLLRELWRTGDRAGFAELFDVVDGLTDEPLGPALTVRAAQCREAGDPRRAAHLLHRAAQGDPSDPATAQALERYAALLDRLGAPEQAAQARQVLAARTGSRRP